MIRSIAVDLIVGMRLRGSCNFTTDYPRASIQAR
jgi:hypothetical protein